MVWGKLPVRKSCRSVFLMELERMLFDTIWTLMSNTVNSHTHSPHTHPFTLTPLTPTPLTLPRSPSPQSNACKNTAGSCSYMESLQYLEDLPPEKTLTPEMCFPTTAQMVAEAKNSWSSCPGPPPWLSVPANKKDVTVSAESIEEENIHDIPPTKRRSWRKLWWVED